MVGFILVNGKMTCDMAEELKYIRMGINTEVSFKTAWLTVMDYIYGATENTIRENGNTVSRMDEAYGMEQMGNSTKACGKLVKHTDGESMFGPMVTHILVIGKHQ